ncbi:hypothetical protein D3C77_443070 [compost metagenome]
MVTTNCAPGVRPMLVPLIFTLWLCSMALTMSSPATVSTRRPGRLASTIKSRLPLPVLPCTLVTLAVTLNAPLPKAVRSAAETGMLQLRSASTVVV